MTPEEKQLLSSMNDKLNNLIDVFYKTNLPDNQIFDKKVTIKNKAVSLGGIRFASPSVREDSCPEIRGGSAVGDAGIKAEIGYTSPNGSLYLSTSPTQPVYVMVGTTWTVLNVP